VGAGLPWPRLLLRFALGRANPRVMREGIGFIVASLLTLLAQADTPDASVPAKPPAPACLSAARVEELARDVLREPGPLSHNPYMGPLSPPLPAAWPPSGEPAVRLYAFRSEPLPTGVVAWRYWSPHAAAQVTLRGEGSAKVQRLKSKGLGRSDERVQQDSSASVEQATAALLQALCRGTLPTDTEAETLRAGYRAWADSQPLIARELRTRAPAFFTWLETQAAEGR
jgi:hypothetical protein